MNIWAEMAAHFMVATGIDGFGLDIEGAIYTLLAANSTGEWATMALVFALCEK